MNDPGVLGIVCAYRKEAQPFIESLRLKKHMQTRGVEVFRSEEYALIISGRGKLSSAIATTRLFYEFAEMNFVGMVNFGLAGCADEKNKGRLFRLSSVCDVSSGKTFFPDLLFSSRLQRECRSSC